MINYSITMRSVNSNLIADAEFNLVASRSAQAAVIKAIKRAKPAWTSALQLLLATAQMAVALTQAAALAKAPVPTQAAIIRATQDRTAAARTTNCRREINLM